VRYLHLRLIWGKFKKKAKKMLEVDQKCCEVMGKYAEFFKLNKLVHLILPN
jgi:hypothetical protein